MIFVITDGSYLNSLSQINRALKSGLIVEAIVIHGRGRWMSQRHVRCDVIVKMTDLSESAYNQLVGIDDYNCSAIEQLKYDEHDSCPCIDPYSFWEFRAVDRFYL